MTDAWIATKARRLYRTHLNAGFTADGLIFKPGFLRGGGGMPPLSESLALLSFWSFFCSILGTWGEEGLFVVAKERESALCALEKCQSQSESCFVGPKGHKDGRLCAKHLVFISKSDVSIGHQHELKMSRVKCLTSCCVAPTGRSMIFYSSHLMRDSLVYETWHFLIFSSLLANRLDLLWHKYST